MDHSTRCPPRRSRRPLAVVLVLTALAVGCGDGEGRTDPKPPTASTADRPSASSRPTTTSSSTTSVTTASATSVPPTTSGRDGAPDAAEQEVIDRYLGYWAARLEANSGVPDPAHPGLAEFATGAQLDAAMSEAQSNLEAGLAYRQREDPAAFQRVEVVSIDGNTALVQECFVDDGLVVRQDTGEVVDDDITTHNVRADLVREDGGDWRVLAVRAIQVWEGVAGCALVS
jgi:hypothetical protein